MCTTIEFYYEIRSRLEGTYTIRIIYDFCDLFLKLAPYLIVSIAVNVIVTQYFSSKKITFSKKNEYLSILSAALIGLVSPLPTYVAIPIGVSLISVGIPFSAVMAFIISSPLINPSIFFLTATQIGLEMAVARTVTAFILGLTGGLLTIRIFKPIFNIEISTLHNEIEMHKRSLWKEIYRNALYVGKKFSVAILISSTVKAVIPAEEITCLLGGNAATGTLTAIALGVPLYTCGGAAIPLIQTLMEMGMSKGSVLAFFIAGPATKLETVYAYKSILGTKVLIFFLALTLVFSYLAGIIYSFI